MIVACHWSGAQNKHKGFEVQNQDTNKLLQKIQRVLKQNRSFSNNLGLVISDDLSKSSSIIFDHNENRKFILASLSKIITASVILDEFPLYQAFETSFYAQQKIENGVLKGPLYLKGGGDPSFVSESLWVLVNNLLRSGLKRVEGPLLLDDSLFEPYRRKKNLWYSSDRSYSSYLSALSFNWNSVSVYVRPGEVGKPPRIFADPQNAFVKVKNKALTKNIKSKHRLSVIRKVNAFGNTIDVSGFISPRVSESVFYKNVTQPTLWTGYNALEFLKRRGISFGQETVEKGKRNSQFVLAKQKGRTVAQLVQDMMKHSSNFIADMLTIQLSLLHGAPRGNLRKGLQQIRRHIEKKGIKNYTFESPSGLSRNNRFKPKDVLTFLIHDFHSLNSFEKISAYAIPQGRGSLSERLGDLNSHFMVRAKTGRLNGVVGLAGYVKNQKGQRRAFVFIYNGSRQRQNKAQKIFDEMVLILSQN